MVQALYHIDFNLGPEYGLWLNEITKTVVVFGIVHVLQVVQDPTRMFLNEDFLQALIFTLLGYSFYHLVWKKLVHFVHDDDEIEGFQGTLRFFDTNSNL